MKENEYQCEACKKIYEKGWSDDEAITENELLHGDRSISKGVDQATVCDDCFNEMRKQGLF